jgi:hypothetical protein
MDSEPFLILTLHQSNYITLEYCFQPICLLEKIKMMLAIIKYLIKFFNLENKKIEIIL